MIDLLTLALTHALILLALWRLLFRDELDVEDPPARARRPWARNAPEADREPGDA